MHLNGGLLPAVAGVGVLALGLSLAAQEPTFRSGSRVVPSYVTAVDANNRLVTDLTRDDFEVFDNGRPQEITIFDNEVRPFTAVVMLDTSVSMTDRLKDLLGRRDSPARLSRTTKRPSVRSTTKSSSPPGLPATATASSAD